MKNLYQVATATSAFENFCTIQTFLEIFCHDTRRAQDIFNYCKNHNLHQTIFYKMSEFERERFSAFFNQLMSFETYSQMCDFVENFTLKSKATI